MADGPQYKIASGEPTRKWKYATTSGAGTALLGGPTLGLLLNYYLGRIDPAMPADIRTAASGFLAGLATLAVTAIVGWATRPAGDDRPVLDLPRPIEPPKPPGIE